MFIYTDSDVLLSTAKIFSKRIVPNIIDKKTLAYKMAVGMTAGLKMIVERVGLTVSFVSEPLPPPPYSTGLLHTGA